MIIAYSDGSGIVRSHGQGLSPWGCTERNDLSSLYLYITSFHRLKSILDIKEAMDIMRMPISKDLDRCRDVNATHMKCLPNVFFIGASKCGTTSIIEYLEQQECETRE